MLITLDIPEATPSLNEMLRRHWSPEEEQRLRDEYPRYREDGKVPELARLMGRSAAAVHVRASRLGIGIRSHPKKWASTSLEEMMQFEQLHNTMSDAGLAKRFGLTTSGVEKRRAALGLNKDPSLMWKHTPHPRGFLGGRHSDLVRRAQSELARALWNNPNCRLNSEEYRQALSDRSSKLQALGKFRNRYSKGAMGARADLGGQYFRSSWEANYARYLNFLKEQRQIDRWEYEADTFWFEKIKRGTRSYTPDFKVWERGRIYYVEVKGWMDDKSATKLRRMSLYYPNVEIQLVDNRQYQSLSKQLRRLIPGWEIKRQYREAATRIDIEALA